MEKENIRISAKNLGQLALPGFCPRCFYIKLKLQFKLPFQIFPGIFSSIDSYSKKITWTYFEKYQKLTPWFSDYDFVKPLPVPGWSRFSFVDKDTNIELRGTPDEIFLMKNNSYAIIDYKTARFTAHQDSLSGMYKIQLNSYALIAEKTKLFSPVEKLILTYYEPFGGLLEVKQLEEVLKEDGFNMPFSVHLLEIDLDAERVGELLKEVRGLVDRAVVPVGRDGCEDCRRLGEMMGVVGR